MKWNHFRLASSAVRNVYEDLFAIYAKYEKEVSSSSSGIFLEIDQIKTTGLWKKNYWVSAVLCNLKFR